MDRIRKRCINASGSFDAREALAVGSRTSKRRLAIIVLSILFTLWFFLPYETKAYLLSQKSITACTLDHISTTCPADIGEPRIPNIVHFVYILKDGATDFPFQFSHFLSTYAVSYRWQPDKIYLHTNVDSDSETVKRARSGESGKWSKLIFDLPNFTINTVTIPTHAGNGRKIASQVHQSDFVRVKAVHDLGGIYIDMDVHALQAIDPLRRVNFEAIGGRQLGGELNSGTFMSAKGSKLIKGWMDRMNEFYDGGWTTHSNQALTYVAGRLEKEPCEVLTLGRDAFAPGGWSPVYNHKLWDTHSDHFVFANNTTEDTVPKDDRRIDDIINQEALSNWTEDYHCSFLLHAFSSKNPRSGIIHNDITPRSVLERRSNFARAVYPVVKVLLVKGIIDVDDSDQGF